VPVSPVWCGSSILCPLPIHSTQRVSPATWRPAQRPRTFTDRNVPTGDNVDVVNWSIIEVTCAIICGSLPTLRPLFRSVPGLVTSLKSRDGTKTSASAGARHNDQLSSTSKPLKDLQHQFSAGEGPFEKLQNVPVSKGSAWREAGSMHSMRTGEARSPGSLNSQLEYELQQWTTEDKEQKVRAAL
jgi:hypothetical protein